GELEEWGRVEQRMDRIIGAAAEHGVSVLVDAEETWIQDPVDAVTMQMMKKYNTRRPVVYNTVQLYRWDRLQFLQDSTRHAWEGAFIPAMKLVRGAYMEKERKRAADRQY